MLTQAEQQELDILREEKKQGLLDTQEPSGNLTPEEQAELSQLRAERDSGELELETISPSEADLGFVNRAKYAIEPLESNRQALLDESFGEENTRMIKGEPYILQDGLWKPVNAEGVSTADFADLAGATPEILGAGAGVVLGAGVGSVPAAIIGGAGGSVVRQGLSALLGTPQEASGVERATETILSGVLSGAGAGAGKVVKSVVRKAIKSSRKLFPKMNFGSEGLKLIKIAKEQGLPKPTAGQAVGGMTLEVEKALGHRRFFGRKVRKETAAQVKAIKENLETVSGEFVNVDTPLDEIGSGMKVIIEHTIEKLRKTSGGFFDEVKEIGKDIMVPAKDFQVSLLDNFEKLGVFDINGNKLRHSSKTMLTPTEFKRVQDVFGTLLEDVKTFSVTRKQAAGMLGKGGDEISASSVNTMRRFIQANIKSEGGIDNVLMMKLRDSLLDTTQDMLGSKSPSLRFKFSVARSLWADMKEMEKQFSKGGIKGLGIKDLSDEKVLEKVFSDRGKIKIFKKMAGDKATEKAGLGYINSILTKKLGGADQIAAAGALNTIKAKRFQIIEAVGKVKYQKLVDNLFYLEKIGRPINPSKTSVVQMMNLSPANLFSGAAERINYAAKTALPSIEAAGEKLIGRSQKYGPKGLSAITDEYQREQAAKTRGPKSPPKRNKVKHESIWDRSRNK